MKFENYFITFDIETGGLKAEKNAVTEVAMIATNHLLEDVSEYESLIKPYGDYTIEEQALKATGMSLELIKTGKEVEEVVGEIAKYLTKHKVGRNKPILCGHNIAKFDIPFMIEMFRYCKRDFLSLINEDFYIDTMWWGRIMWNESVNYKLSTCCDNAGVELVDAHRAMSDTRSNKDLVKYFLSNLRTEGSKNNQKRFRETFQF